MITMEPAYHLPPILSPVKGVRTSQPSNCFRGKEPGKTQLPPLKRVVAPVVIEKEKITTPRLEHDQQHVAKKKRKKKRNRCRSHEPSAMESEIHLATLSQSTRCARRVFQPSSPSVHNCHSVVEELEDHQTTLDFSHKYSDGTQGEPFPRVGDEPYLRYNGKMQAKARNAKARTLEHQKGIQADHLDDDTARIDYTQSADNGPSIIQVLSSDQSNVRREGKEDYLEELGWTDKSFHQKRRGTRIVQSKEHPHSVHPLEFHPHPPPQFRSTTCKTPNALMSHPNLPANDSRLNFSNLPRNGHPQVRQVCMHGGSIPSVTSEFQPHPPLQPRNFFNQIRQCHSLTEYPAIPLEGQTSSSGQCTRNTPNFNKAQPLFPMEGFYPDRCPESKSLCKSIGHHSYKNVTSSSPMLSGFAPHISRDHLMQSQQCLPSSPISKNFHFRTPTSHHSNRVYPLAEMSQGQDGLQNTASTGLNSEGSSVSGQHPYFPTGVRLPANYQWAIIDESGSVTPLPPGSFPAAPKKDSEESSQKPPNSPEGSFDSFPPPASPTTFTVHLPSIKGTIVEESSPKLQTSKATSAVLESVGANAPPKRKQRCLEVGSEQERPVDRLFEPSPTNVHCKKKRGKRAGMGSKESSYKEPSMDNNQPNVRPLAPSALDSDEAFFKDSPSVSQSARSYTQVPNEKLESLSNGQHSNVSLANGEKKQRNFKLPMGWCANSKNWFKSPFKKEKKHHQKTTSFPPENVHPLLLAIDEFSSLNISDEKTSGSPEGAKDNMDKKKKSVYTLGEFLKLFDDSE